MPDDPNPYADLDAEAEILQKAITDVCNDHQVQVVVAVLSVMLEWAVVRGVDDVSGLHAYLELFSAETHKLWLRERSRLGGGGAHPSVH